MDVTDLVNIQGTEAGSVTVGLPEARSELKRLAIKYGPDTPEGHAAYNLLEATENYDKHPELRAGLAPNIESMKQHLAALLCRGNPNCS